MDFFEKRTNRVLLYVGCFVLSIALLAIFSATAFGGDSNPDFEVVFMNVLLNMIFCIVFGLEYLLFERELDVPKTKKLKTEEERLKDLKTKDLTFLIFTIATIAIGSFFGFLACEQEIKAAHGAFFVGTLNWTFAFSILTPALFLYAHEKVAEPRRYYPFVGLVSLVASYLLLVIIGLLSYISLPVGYWAGFAVCMVGLIVLIRHYIVHGLPFVKAYKQRVLAGEVEFGGEDDEEEELDTRPTGAAELIRKKARALSWELGRLYLPADELEEKAEAGVLSESLETVMTIKPTFTVEGVTLTGRVDYKIAKTAEDFDDESEWKKFSKACDQRVREADDALKKQLFYIKSELEKYIKELNKTYKDAGNRKVVLAPLPPKLRHAYESKPYDL